MAEKEKMLYGQYVSPSIQIIPIKVCIVTASVGIKLEDGDCGFEDIFD